MPKGRLAVFDLDRTLLDGRTIHHLARTFEVHDPACEAWQAYRDGQASWQATKQRVAALFEGVAVDDLAEACREVPFHPDAKRVVEALRSRDFHVAVVTASYHPAAERAAEELDIDWAQGTRLGVENGTVTGRLEGPTFTGECGRWICKQDALFHARERFQARESVAVGDGPNDACMLAAADLGVAVDPERAEAVEAADHVAEIGDVPALVDEWLDTQRSS